MFCYNCGSKLVDNANFCAKCGSKVIYLDDVVTDEKKDEMKEPEKAFSEKKENIEKTVSDSMKKEMKEYVKNNFSSDEKTEAIKYVRDQTGWGLRRTKEFVDTIKFINNNHSCSKESSKQTKKSWNDFLKDYVRKGYDFIDLQKAMDKVAEDLETKLDLDFSVCVVSSKNRDSILDKINTGEKDECYIFISSLFNYCISYRTYKTVGEDEIIQEWYYDLNSLPSDIGVEFDVITNSEEKNKVIVNQLRNLYKTTTIFKIPVDNGNNQSICFGCNIKESNDIKIQHTNFGDTMIFYSNIKCEKYKWCHKISDNGSDVKKSNRYTLRQLQLAQCYAIYCELSTEYNRQLTLYENLCKGAGLFATLLGPASTPEYDQLKKLVRFGQPISEQLVNEAFPHLSLIYHKLYYDVCMKTPMEQVKNEFYQIVEVYKQRLNVLSNELGLPENLGIKYCGYTQYSNTMRCNLAIKYCIEKIENNLDISVSSMINEYRKMVIQAVEIGREKAEYERELRETQGPGILSSMIRQGVENRNIKNNIGKTGKRDLIGQAGCAKNNGGNCSNCNLNYACSRY